MAGWEASAGVSGSIKLPDGMTRERSAKRLRHFADKVQEAIDNSDDRAVVESALVELYPDQLPDAQRSAKAQLADAIRRGDEGGIRSGLAIAPAAAIKAPRSYGNHGGHLDWHAFVVDAVDKPSGPPPQPDVEREAFIPSKVTYRGMPVSRWWEFEDAQVNFGAVEANPEDIARMLLTEFAISYGDDAFLVPIEVPVGSLAQVRSLVVSDTFGERHVIPSIASVDGPDGRWRMFGLCPRGVRAVPARRSTLCSSPPCSPRASRAPSIEEVLLLRDEMANMAWGVERVVESAAGGSLDRQRAIQENQPPTTEPPPAAEVLAYRLASNVPAHWIPLVPVRAPGEERSVGLGLAAVPRYAVDGTELPPAGPAGQLLAPLNLPNALLLREEEVPRAGARVTRAWQLGRWIDGSTHVWMGRRKSAGRGEGSSGLRFDYLEGRGAE